MIPITRRAQPADCRPPSALRAPHGRPLVNSFVWRPRRTPPRSGGRSHDLLAGRALILLALGLVCERLAAIARARSFSCSKAPAACSSDHPATWAPVCRPPCPAGSLTCLCVCNSIFAHRALTTRLGLAPGRPGSNKLQPRWRLMRNASTARSPSAPNADGTPGRCDVRRGPGGSLPETRPTIGPAGRAGSGRLFIGQTTTLEPLASRRRAPTTMGTGRTKIDNGIRGAGARARWLARRAAAQLFRVRVASTLRLASVAGDDRFKA